MKFAKQLDENAVPEWREKYLDYKQAKKKLKAAARAIRHVERSPLKSNQGPSPFVASLREAPVYSFLTGRGRGPNNAQGQPLAATRSRSELPSPTWRRQDELERGSGAVSTPIPVNERSPLRQDRKEAAKDQPRLTRYGSIIGSPGNSPSPPVKHLRPQKTQASLLELPDPALNPERSKDGQQLRVPDPDPEYDRPVSPGSPDPPHLPPEAPQPPPTQVTNTGNAYQVGKTSSKPDQPSPRPKYQSLWEPRRTNSSPLDTRPTFLRRVMSLAGGTPPAAGSGPNSDVELAAYREVDFRRAEFFFFLERELHKIEDFYNSKEDEASQRIKVLRDQLHIMRKQRVEELEAAEYQKRKQQFSNGDFRPETNDTNQQDSEWHFQEDDHHHRWTGSVVSQMENALDKVRTGHVGKTSKAMRDLGTPSFRLDPDNRDYTRKPQATVSYRTAKRKLKAAFIEYYRGLDLLKSYALLNHTAFRKITKKSDKTFTDSPGKKFMKEEVDRAHFVNSQTVDELMQLTEDFYARYFERGNRKIAISKLRSKGYGSFDYSGSMFRVGLFGGVGFALAIQGLVYGVDDRHVPSGRIREQADFLLQIYAGYFLLLVLVAQFCLACRIFKQSKVNYGFIFELDTRNSLDWRQLSELPAICLFLMGLTMVLNFQLVGGLAMFVYWPVVLIGLTVLIIGLPAPIWYPKTRLWFWETLGRVGLSGAFPVEFRDLIFGDMFCSETYAFGNIEMYFCLYAKHWQDPPQCGSSHSRVFGFFQALPGIFRAIQCLRRYAQTRNAFPHLANCLKYICTILSYMALSIYRIDSTWSNLAFFIAVSTINSFYCSVWDLIMDWSMGDLSAKHPFLREQLQFKPIWWYYTAMVLDVILRFNWIFYVIFRNDVQHSTIVSFCVSLSEVFRRGVWTLFRVENEQCANNKLLKAARELPVPYSLEAFDSTTADVQPTQAPPTTPAPLSEESPVMQTLRRVGSTMTSAHVQDYVRRRKPEAQEPEIPESDEEE